MPKPIPGKQYTVQDETTLSQVSQRAYGDPVFWIRIASANQSNIRKDNPDTTFSGEVLNIPVIAEIEELKPENILTGKNFDDLTILIDGFEIKTVATRIIRTMDTMADGWTATIPWIPGKDKILDNILIPFSYLPASVYIGNELIINGLLYTTTPKLTADARTVDLEGWSFTADLIDSMMKPPYEQNGVTFFQILVDIVKNYSISVISDLTLEDLGGPFDRVTANETETVENFLTKLAAQRNLLLSSTPNGNLFITRTTTDLKPVAVIEEGQYVAEEFSIRFDGRKRFNSYRAIGRSPFGNKIGIANDNNVPLSRFKNFIVDESIEGDIEQAAKWRRNKQLAQTLTIPFIVESWFTPSGKLWRENTIVTVKSDVLHVPDGFDFLIRAVEYIEDIEGQKTILSLIPPQTYTGKDFTDPWS